MKTYATWRKVRVFLALPFLAIGGCAAMGFGYGVSVDESGPYDIDPYATDLYGYDVGLDPYGYPYADWYGGYGYPGYVVRPAAVFPYGGSSLTGAPYSGREIRPHPGPSPRPRARGAAL